MLWGPMNHIKHLTNVDRLPFSITYVVTLLGTIYYSIWVIFKSILIITRVFLGSKLFFYDHLCFITNWCSDLVIN
jgi:hypothetical protein